jgi:hypothetical protein
MQKKRDRHLSMLALYESVFAFTARVGVGLQTSSCFVKEKGLHSHNDPAHRPLFDFD